MGKCVWKKLIPQEREKTPVKWKGKVKENVKSKLSHFSTFFGGKLAGESGGFHKKQKENPAAAGNRHFTKCGKRCFTDGY